MTPPIIALGNSYTLRTLLALPADFGRRIYIEGRNGAEVFRWERGKIYFGNGKCHNTDRCYTCSCIQAIVDGSASGDRREEILDSRWRIDEIIVDPTDAKIVAAFEASQRENKRDRRLSSLVVDGKAIPMTTVQEAWSRELRRRMTNKEREKVLGPIDDPDFA